MSIYDGPYFKLNKHLCTAIGLWPYAASKHVTRYLAMNVLIASSIIYVFAIITHHEDVDRLILSILILGSLIAITAKLFTMVTAEKQTQKLYESLEDIWIIIEDDKEKKILTNYAEIGRIATILYASTMGSVSMLIIILPLVSSILDIIIPLSTPRESIQMTYGGFLIDRENPVILTFISGFLLASFVSVLTISFNTMYMNCCLQCCALLTVIRRRLQLLCPMGSDISSDTDVEDYNSYDHLTETIILHQTAVNFISSLNDVYSMCFLYIIMMNVFLIPLDIYAVFSNLNLNEPSNILPYLFYFLAILIHLFVFFWPAELIKSYGEDLYKHGYNNEWYETPRQTEKILMIFMLRCSRPLFLTAGGFIKINFRTYTTIIKVAIYYIIILASFRLRNSS